MEINWREHYIKKGDPKAPTYYIIRRAFQSAGLFSNYLVFAGHIRYALSKGYIPVIDMQNYTNTYLRPELLGKENSWEYFFTQPLGIDLEHAHAGENVILSEGEAHPADQRPNDTMKYYNNVDGILTEWRMIVKLGLLKIRPEIQQEIDDTYNKLFSPNDRVLGVKLRGTDYVAYRFHAHPIPPPIEYAVSNVIAKFNKWKCNKIFLATEDKSYDEIFRRVFGNLVVTIDKDYINYNVADRKAPTAYHTKRENDYFLLGKEYLTEMAMLAKCNSFITTKTSGSVCVMMMRENDFEHLHVFNLGNYNILNPEEYTDD